MLLDLSICLAFCFVKEDVSTYLSPYSRQYNAFIRLLIVHRRMSNVIIQNIRHRHANPNTVYHALYGHYFLGISKQNLATIYGKSLSTIYSWFTKYEKDGLFRRKQRKQVYKKYGTDMRTWLVDLYRKEPMLFLDEAKHKFQLHFRVSISVSSVCAIFHEAGLSWKVIERRAIQIRYEEIVRFTRELLAIPWDLFNLIFFG